MSLFLDIGKGAGLAGATGVRPFLPPLLAGALARGDIGIDFSHTDFSFLESPAFLAGVLAVAVLAYAVERSRGGRAPEGRDPLSLALAGVALTLGSLLFAGSLADGNHQSWPGLIAGAACAALGYAALAVLFGRARRRLQGGAATLLDVYADGIALGLAGLSIALPPVGIVAVIAFVFLIVRGRAGGKRKYEGLRVLR